ncbi:MAG: fused MFS/spermidine synthase [Myxococcota bacterium]
MTTRLLLIGFFLSGLTGLLYQSLWIRMLTLVMGGTTAALTTVLIAFMGGLALGSALFGRAADHTRRPVRVYALLELAIGAWALGLPWVYAQVPALYQILHRLDPGHGWSFNLARFALALLFFGLPATLMGGTLPLIIQALRRHRPELQQTVASAYAINTFGATLGAFLAGFVVIPTLGLTPTLMGTGLFNIALGVIFWYWLGRQEHETPVPSVETSLPDALTTPSHAHDTHAHDTHAHATPTHAHATLTDAQVRRPFLLLLFFLMGASSLSYEILWHRLLGLSFGSSVYAVSTMLTTFLLGIALGSWWWRRQGERAAQLATLGWIEVGIAVSGALTALALAWLPHAVQYLYLLPYIATQLLGPRGSELGFWGLQAALFGLGVLLMGIPTSLMGASFPVAVKLYADGAVGQSIGRVYGANTLGSIVGLALTGFVLIEAFGTQRVIQGFNLLNGGLGLLLLLLSQTEQRRRVLWAAGILGATFLLPRWDVATLTSGVYYHTLGARDNILGGETVRVEEDDMGLVSVHRSTEWDQPDPIYVMKFNGKFMGAEGSRLPVLQQFAHLPLLMHGPGARSALVIGLGGGFTVEAALTHPLEQVDAVEISAGVIRAAQTTRPQIFADPRLRVLEEDARSLVLTTERRYDVIISETSDPWMTGVSNLYTVEFFRWLRQTLAPGGVFGTWLQVRHKRLEDVQTIFATMHAAFPHMVVAELSEGDVMLLMSDQPLSLDAAFVHTLYARQQSAFEAAHLRTPWSLPAKLVLDEPALQRYVAGAPINTDELPLIEFRTPRSLNIGLRGEEVREALRAQAPEKLTLPLKNAQPGDALAWEVSRALWLGRPAQALKQLEGTPAPESGLPPGEWAYLSAVAILRQALEGPAPAREQQLEQALAYAQESPVSARRALLVAACLVYLERWEALEQHLAAGEGWPAASGSTSSSADLVEKRIATRRGLLQQALGLASPR